MSSINLTSAERREAVAIMRERYPKFDRSLLAKATNSDRYGVIIHPDGVAMLSGRFPDEFPGEISHRVDNSPTCAPASREGIAALTATKPKKRDTHRLTCRVQCRLEREIYTELLRIVDEEGFETIQDWLSDLIGGYVDERSSKCEVIGFKPSEEKEKQG